MKKQGQTQRSQMRY